MTDVERLLGDRIALYCGDCRNVLAQLDENSIDSCVTDPPYHLTSIVRRFADASENDDTVTSKRVRDRSDGYARLVATGFMGKVWDGGDIAFRPEVWREIYRLLKPGAHLLAFGGTRTYHRLACAIEDAGFEIRDTIMWLYGSGFPKSHDVSKGIDRAAGMEREIIGPDPYAKNHPNPRGAAMGQRDITAPATGAARQWEGWGTALKPACELIVLARKPLSENTVAANVLKWETGAINVDGCRIAADENTERPGAPLTSKGCPRGAWANDVARGRPSTELRGGNVLGRWPANVIHDGSEEVVAAFPANCPSGGGIKGARPEYKSENLDFQTSRKFRPVGVGGDSGSAARFFYTAKADSDDRLGSKHPTVKPLDLMQYLVGLITPPKGTCLDPFAGTGTTGEAAWREGMRAVLIERESEYQEDIRRRMGLALAGPDERARESIKARNLPREDGPLFDWADSYDGADDFAKSIDEAYRVIRERKAAGGKGWPE